MILVYHVYIFDFNVNRARQVELIRRFDEEKSRMDARKRAKLPIKRTHDENDIMSFDTLDEFCKKKRWDFITRNVLENPDFMNAVNTLNRKSFSIR